jgi:hypothetical protein
MRKAVLFTLVLLVSAVCMQAQAAPPASGNSSSTTTLQGCLKFEGHYRLTDSSGVVHQLTGAANRLTHYVNRQIEVTGTPVIRSVDGTQQGEESSVKEQHVFRVKTIKQIADSCSASQ